MAEPSSSGSGRTNGILQLHPGSGQHDSRKSGKSKVPNEGFKAMVRRIPPGMTEDEFISILGEDWKVGAGKVDWLSYDAGKVSKDRLKPSTASTAHLRIIYKDDVLALSEVVRTATWEDARETFTSPSLIGPPILERSIYQKVPSGKRRTDSKQGTIDQDPEFMKFLEELANPDARKDGDGDTAAEDAEVTETKVSTTPLIEYLKEKKANKAREAAAAKSAKHARQESQGGGKGKGLATEEPTKKKGKDKAGKGDRPRETVKILTKKAAAEAAAEAAKAVASQLASPAGSSTAAASASTSRDAPAAAKSRRAGIAAAARILQRDLGLSPGNAHRKAREDAAKAGRESKAASAATAPGSAKEATPTESMGAEGSADAAATSSKATRAGEQQATPSTPKTQSASSARRSRGRKQGAGTEPAEVKSGATKAVESSAGSTTKTPVLLLKKREEPPSSDSSTPISQVAPPSSPVTAKAAPNRGGVAKAASRTTPKPSTSRKKESAPSATTPGATRAFVKHANPSQGVTEALLKEAMQVFGGVTFVEIDKRKGFAYVDFADHDSLVKAIGASPMGVAQATVQVLERKETPAARRVAAHAEGSAAAAETTPASGATASEAPLERASAAGENQDRSERRGGRRRGGRGRGAESTGKDAVTSAPTTDETGKDTAHEGTSSAAAPVATGPE